MKNNLLLEEEIEKIKRLSGLNEAAGGPNQAIARLIATIQSTPLSDDVIREFEVLANGGKISINKSSKKITSIIWKDLSDDEVKLLFKSQEISDIFKKILNDNNIATDPTAIALYSPNLKKIIKGYEDAKNLPKIGGGSPNPGSTSNNFVGRYTGNIVDTFNNLFGGRIDDVTLRKILDKKSQLRLDLENQLKLKVGPSKSHLVAGAIDKAAKRVSELTDGLTEQTAYNKVFETAFTQIGIKRTNSEVFKKYFGWYFKMPWWAQGIGYAVFLSEVLNPLLGTNYTILGVIKWIFGTTKQGVIGDVNTKENWEGSIERLKKSVGSENAPQSNDNGGKDVTTY